MTQKVLPSAGPGRPKDPAKRKAILEAAKILFLANGYEGSSMDAIAAEAGVSKLTVYSHFSDKENLFVEAVKSKCEEQLPELMFEFDDKVSLEQSLLTIGMGFSDLINSRESLELHRVMMSLAAQGSKLPKMFYDAGPLRLQLGMEELLRKADLNGKLRVSDPCSATDHFFSLLKGGCNYRLLMGCGEPPSAEAAAAHVRDAVGLFLRAFRAD
jgi:TetR/AcrR family transcriptional repressor of mexJK operon